MASAERDRDSSAEITDEIAEDGPALRDAAAALERAARDEADAAATRDRLRDHPLDVIAPDAAVAPHLASGERVHALRASAILSGPGDKSGLGYGGTLYLTSRRLVHLGQVIVTVQLSDIAETDLAGDRLLLTLRSGEGLQVAVDRPRRLRAELAAAMREARG
jgi:hypothetical protein